MSAQEIYNLCCTVLGENTDHVMLAFGAGGGTGGGSLPVLLSVAQRYANYIQIGAEKRIGALVTLPTHGEATGLAGENADAVMAQLYELAAKGGISPLIVIDNDKIHRQYRRLTVANFHGVVNSTIAGLFHIFNVICSKATSYTSFDPTDYTTIVRASGCMLMGVTGVTDELDDQLAVANAVKANLEKTLLAGGFDLSTAKVSGCIMVGGQKMFAEVPGLKDTMDIGFDTLGNMTGTTVHRGIYEDNKETLRVYTIIGGLERPS
jgi:cell division GTPase FtsZ